MNFNFIVSRNKFFSICILYAISIGFSSVLFAKDEVVLSQNFNNVEIKTVIEAVAKITKHNFIIDPRVKGKVTLIAPKQMSSDSLYKTLLTILSVHGYTAVEDGDVTKILPTNLARYQLSYKKSGPKDLKNWITEVLTVYNVEAKSLVGMLRPLMSREGHLVGLTKSNKLIITDTINNVKRIKIILKRIDVDYPSNYEIIEVKNSSAQDVVKIIKAVVAKGGSKFKLTFDDRSNRIIVSGTRQERLKVRAMIADLDVHVPSSGNVSVVYLRYAKATDLVSVLQQIANNPGLINSSPEGKPVKKKKSKQYKNIKNISKSINVQADKRMNAIIISAPPVIVSSLKNIIKQLDVRRAQVLIEAVLVEVSTSKAAELGVEWVANGPNGVGLVNFSGAIPNILANKANPAAQAQSIGSGMTTGLGELSADNKGWAALIRALNGDSSANILSTPTLLTLDNEDSEIVVGREVPFRTGSYTSTGTNSSNPSNPFQTIKRKNIGMKLKVKPQINEGDEIHLQINLELSNVLPRGEAVDLETSKRQIKTNVIIGDGNVIVLGGLLSERETETVTKVPFLGDIPFLGALFRSKRNTREKINLMMFLRPVIVRNNKMSEYYSSRKYNKIYKSQIDSLDSNDTYLIDGYRPKMRLFEEWKNDGAEELYKKNDNGQSIKKLDKKTSKAQQIKSKSPKKTDLKPIKKVVIQPKTDNIESDIDFDLDELDV